MATPFYGERFNCVLNALRRRCPVPVTVRTVDEEILRKYWSVHFDKDEETPFSDCLDISKVDKDGNPLKTKRKWRIRIMRKLTEDEAIDALIHEWAHAMDEFHNGPATEQHRMTWGECYAKAHRAAFHER